MSEAQIDPRLKDWLNRVEQDVLNRMPSSQKNPAAAAPSQLSRISQNLKSLNHVDQIMVGMSLVGAVMGIVNSFDYARHSVSHNEQGEAKIQPSMICLSIMHAGLALGSAIIGATIMKNAHMRG